MSELLHEINIVGNSTLITKQERIVGGILNCIEDGRFALGDPLPSVNELSRQLGYARETIVKSYKELKERGIIKSKQGVGYFVASNNPDLRQSVAMVLYGFQTFQQDFYNTFRKSLGKDYQIDIFFHHNNFKIYESIIDSILASYGMYVIAPIQNQSSENLLSRFNPERLIIVDRYQYVDKKVSKVTQEFEQSLLNVFEELQDKIQQYDEIILYYREGSDYPKGILEATQKYCAEENIKLSVREEFEESDLASGILFFTIGDSDLWTILKTAKIKGLKIGKDIGILSHNDSPVKEIIEGGITTFSTDFNLMAKHAAKFISNKKYINKIIPSKLIIRKSL